MDKYTESNRHMWDLWTQSHVISQTYDLESFKKGECSLNDPEIKALGDVEGKTMLHLQCHFGMDSLSWARKGAIVTGVDISSESIEFARKLSEQLKIPAKFLQSDVYDLPETIDEKFDIVFCSYGILHWLPDLSRWAKIIKSFLKPNGIFYLIDVHPLARTFRTDDQDWVCRGSYFSKEQPNIEMTTKSYTEIPTSPAICTTWQHSLSEIFTALLNEDFEIKKFNEYHWCYRKAREDMVQIDRHKWVPSQQVSIPFTFELMCMST